MRFTIFIGILRHVLDLDYSILQEHSLESRALQMQIMQDPRMKGGLPLISVLFMVITPYHGKAQAVEYRYSAEAEYRAMAQGTCELLWLRSLLSELGFPDKNSSLF